MDVYLETAQVSLLMNNHETISLYKLLHNPNKEIPLWEWSDFGPLCLTKKSKVGTLKAKIIGAAAASAVKVEREDQATGLQTKGCS